jgi:hypothetical protein
MFGFPSPPFLALPTLRHDIERSFLFVAVWGLLHRRNNVWGFGDAKAWGVVGANNQERWWGRDWTIQDAVVKRT